MEAIWIKSKAVFSLFFGLVFGFLLPLLPFLGMVCALVATDFFTGVRAAKKRGEKITSGGMKRTVEKTVLYFAAIILSEGMVQVFFPGVPLTYVVSTYIALTEFKSNIENISSATGVDLWKRIIEKVGLYRFLYKKAAEAKTDGKEGESSGETVSPK